MGREYRSGTFGHDDEQRAVAERARRDLDASGAYPAPVVTELAPCESFQPASDKHRDYFARNPEEQY